MAVEHGGVERPAAEAANGPRPDEIMLWQWDLDCPGAGEAADRAVLSRAERARADGFLVPQAARRFTAGRARLRQTLAAACGGAAEHLPLVVGPKGKPFLPGGPEFNLSHSAGLALFAVAPFPVGVDVEAVRPVEDGVAKLVFTAAELAELRQAPDREATFFRGWTRKEAMVKARGGSLAELRSFSVPLAGPAMVHCPPSWQISDVPVPAGYAAAVAAHCRGWSINRQAPERSG